MFGSNLVTRIYFLKSSHGDRGFKLLLNKTLGHNQSRAARFSHFMCKTVNYNPFKKLLKNRLCCTENFSYRCSSVQASVATKVENSETKTHFQELLSSRKEEACRSVLLHVPEKDDIPYALAKCEQFGVISNAFSYAGEGSNYFVLLEFLNETSTQDLFKSCQYQCKNDIFPVFSRIIQFEKQSKNTLPQVNIEIQDEEKLVSPTKFGRNISEVIEDVYLKEKLTELDTRLRYFYCAIVRDSASSIFPYCEVLPFGSSVNGVGRRGCDLDAMLRLYPDSDALKKLNSLKVKKDDELFFFNKTCIGQKSLQQKVVNFIGVYFQTFLPGISAVNRILHARVPIMKMNHRLLKMDCDVSVNNMSAVFMSDVVHFCGEVDARFRPLLYAVKKWAKEANITSNTPGAWITNFGLTNLLMFFFQMERILPPFIDAFNIVGEDITPDFHLQYLKSIEELKTLASQNQKSLAELLIGFFRFLVEYPFDEKILSLMSGKARSHSQVGAVTLWIQYPFDEDLNVTKNVSDFEFADLQNKAGVAAKSLESKLSQKKFCINDFSTLLGIQNLTKKTPKRVVDVNAYFKDDNLKNKATKLRRV